MPWFDAATEQRRQHPRWQYVLSRWTQITVAVFVARLAFGMRSFGNKTVSFDLDVDVGQPENQEKVKERVDALKSMFEQLPERKQKQFKRILEKQTTRSLRMYEREYAKNRFKHKRNIWKKYTREYKAEMKYRFTMYMLFNIDGVVQNNPTHKRVESTDRTTFGYKHDLPDSGFALNNGMFDAIERDVVAILQRNPI